MRRLAAMVCVVLLACAPEPTTPADTNLGGTWTANAHLYMLSNFRLQIIQEPQGVVSGKWFAKGDGGGGGCPPLTPCDASGVLIGRNTIAQIELELLGAGRFEGTLVAPTRMRGIFAVGESYDTITFNRTQTVLANQLGN
ncbi:MAG TPA: hypothetical protein VHM24_05200 [Gemmatimonadaceae bacterium]|nr:hypothetical protein [Gemmatimonadaceae bacterium]